MVKEDYFMRFVECHHSLFCQIYVIIITKILKIKPELALQIFFKVVNNLVGPNNVNLILLVFDIHPCITEIDASLPIIT